MELRIKYKILKVGKKIISDRLFHLIAHYYLHIRQGVFPKRLNINKPKTFNEKIIWNKLNNRFKGGELLADKFEVRKYVEEVIGQEYLIPLIGVYSNVDEINFDELPNQFVLKATQGSGLNLIVKDKANLNLIEVKKTLNEWLRIDYSIVGREWQYDIKTNKIIIESFISDDLNDDLKDYKYFCFNGVPKYIQVDSERFQGHKRNFYDLNWKEQPFTIMYPRSKDSIDVPKNLNRMNEIAETLAKSLQKELNFSRIDLYNLDGEILFGEVTFHPGGGCEPFSNYEYDLKLGQMISND